MRTRAAGSTAPNTISPTATFPPTAMMPEAGLRRAGLPRAGTHPPVRTANRQLLGRRHLARVLVIALAATLLTGCQTARMQAIDNTVTPGDRLYGRLSPTAGLSDFSFDAVEYSVLSAKLETDEIVESPPQILLFDPDGQQVPTDGLARVEREKATTTISVCGLVLRKTGRYAVSVRPTDPAEEIYFQFTHALSFPGPIPTPVELVSDKLTHVSVMAPRGARVRVRVVADEGSRVRPQINGVRDPMGGRALDRTRLPRGMRAPTMEEGDDEVILEFTAPETGRYTILNASQSGTCGRATVMTSVKAPCGKRRDVRLGGAGSLTAPPMLSPVPQSPMRTTATSPSMPSVPSVPSPRTATAPRASASPHITAPRARSMRSPGARREVAVFDAPSASQGQTSQGQTAEVPVFDAPPTAPGAPAALPAPLLLPPALPGVTIGHADPAAPVALLPPPQVSEESMRPRSGQTPPLAPRVAKPGLLMPPAPLELPPLGPLPRK